jgi:hypothetical protein
VTIPRGLYKIPIHLYGGIALFAKDRKAFEKGYKYLHGEDYPDDTTEGAGLTLREAISKDGTMYYLCGVFDEQQDTIVHESGHLATIVMKRAGINAHDDDGESFCYLLEFLYNEFSKKVFAVKNKSKVLPIDYVDGREW